MKLSHRVITAIVLLILASPFVQVHYCAAQAHTSIRHHPKAAAKKPHQSAAYQQHLKRLAKINHEHNIRLARIEAKARKLQKSPAYRQHLKRLAKQMHEHKIHAAHLQAQARKLHQSAAFRQHLKRLARLNHEHDIRVARLEARSRHARRLAIAEHARMAHLNALARRKDRLATHQTSLAGLESQHNMRLARLMEAHNARLAAHNARLAAAQARRAQNNAWRRERQTQIALAAAKGIVLFGTFANTVPVQAIMVDLNKPNIKVSAILASNGIGSSEPFSHMIQRSHPAVAVTGTFFSLDNLKPVGDIVINGNLAYFGGMGTALAITPSNHADMITVEWGRHHDWSGYDTVVACGPRLLKDGQITLDPHAERFKDQHMLSPNSRIAVGITPGNKLIFAMTRDRIYLGRLAKVMKSLGCSQAMNLDAGSSTGFYCNGKLLANPGRWLTNAIVVHTDGRNATSASRTPDVQITGG